MYHLGSIMHPLGVKKNYKTALLASKTSSSRILVPKTEMPSVLMIAWSLLLSGLEIFFLQSTIIVTVFFSMLIATRCHLLCGKDNKEEP